MGELISCLAGNTYRATACSDSVPRTSLCSRGTPMPLLPPKNMNFILGCAATNSVKLCFDVHERCSDGMAAPTECQPHAYRTASRKPAKIQPAKPPRDNDGSQQQPIFTVSISGTPNASFGISAPC